MGCDAVHFSLLILIIISLFYALYAQQLTPIIGGKCDINSADVPIGGKETQFFLKCEQSLQSESGKGVWVVKSRILSTTPAIPQTSSPTVVATILSIDKEQPSQQPYKSDNVICVEDKSARGGDLCSVPSICLQQEQGQLSSNYLQCDQSTKQWMRKSCLDGRIFSFEHQACILSNVSAFRQSRLGTHHYAQVSPSSLNGIACTFMQCSQNNPCYRGTCNNGYCCTSSTGAYHSYAAPPLYQQQSFHTNQFPFAMSNQMQSAYNPMAFHGCSNGGSPVGTCINMRCARGYLCSPGNICCPSNDYGTVISSTANPMKNPFLCADGTQAAGACILGQCGSSFTCINGLCCNISSNTPRCLDGSPSAGACILGQCGAGFVCTTGNLCCLTNTIPNIIPGTCPNNAPAIGTCINGLCPTGHTCLNGQCCPHTGNTTFRCSNLNYALGPCVAGQCPDGGFQCDTTINSCCPLTDPVGPCIEPGDQCPAGNRCFKEGATPLCFKECGGRGTIFSSPVDGACPTGTALIFGSCCALRARLYNPIQTSFLSERHASYNSWPTSSGIRLCPDHTGPVSACINGQCGHGYQCYNNVCCLPQYTNMILPVLSGTLVVRRECLRMKRGVREGIIALRPIGGPCEFTQQCMSFMEGLSVCEFGTCRCLPGAQLSGFACVGRFSVLLNDAGRSSRNGTSVDEPDKIAMIVEPQ